MEVDSSEMNSDGGRGLDDVEDPSPPEDKMFFMDPADLDVDKDEEAVKTIRFVKSRHCIGQMIRIGLWSSVLNTFPVQSRINVIVHVFIWVG